MQEAFQIEILGHSINIINLLAFAALLSFIGAVLVSAIGYTNSRIAKQLEEDRNGDRQDKVAYSSYASPRSPTVATIVVLVATQKERTGDRRNDAYPEKLRRSFEAIQTYNAGLDDSEQFSVTGSILRQLSGIKPGKVKEWAAGHKDTYNAGYGARQNVGKPDPCSVIKWSEAAYGAYEW